MNNKIINCLHSLEEAQTGRYTVIANAYIDDMPTHPTTLQCLQGTAVEIPIPRKLDRLIKADRKTIEKLVNHQARGILVKCIDNDGLLQDAYIYVKKKGKWQRISFMFDFEVEKLLNDIVAEEHINLAVGKTSSGAIHAYINDFVTMKILTKKKVYIDGIHAYTVPPCEEQIQWILGNCIQIRTKRQRLIKLEHDIWLMN